MVVLSSNALSKKICNEWFEYDGTEYFNRGIIILDTSDLSLIENYSYVSDYFFRGIKQLENGKYIGAGAIEIKNAENNKDYNYYSALLYNFHY